MSDLFPASPPTVSLPRQIEAVERELSMRRRVYPRRVADGKMTQRQADTGIAVMEAVLATLTTALNGSRCDTAAQDPH